MGRHFSNNGRSTAGYQRKLLRAGTPLAALALAGAIAALALASNESATRSRDLTVTGPGGVTSVLPTLTSTLPKPPPPSISSTISSSPADPVAGEPITVSVINQDDNISVSFVTEMVGGFDSQQLSVQSAQSSLGACTTGTTGSQVQCPFGTMTPGNRVVSTIVAMPATAGTYQLTANASPVGPSTSFTLNVLPQPVAVPATTADVVVHAPAVTLAPKVGRTVRAGVTVTDNGPLAGGVVSADPAS